MKKGSMREQMPVVAAFIDDLRATFGAEMIDAQIRKGMSGQPTFYASENGFTVGTKPAPTVMIKRDERGISYVAQQDAIGSNK